MWFIDQLYIKPGPSPIFSSLVHIRSFHANFIHCTLGRPRRVIDVKKGENAPLVFSQNENNQTLIKGQ